MSYLELFLLAVGLCFDTFAVSLSGSLCIRQRLLVRQIMKIIMFFAVFQAGFAFFGWLLGSSMSTYISSVDHWIAFVLLSYIGGSMIREAWKARRDTQCGEVQSSHSLLQTRQLTLLSVATSIDALAVGVTIALTGISMLKIGICTAMVFVCTALAALIGLLGGRKLNSGTGRKSELIGGIILLGIGVKILLEHLFAL